MSGSALNIVIKLIALILAVFLWFNVITQKQYEYNLKLKITQVELPPNLGQVTPLPDSLQVRVMAEGKKLLRDDWKNAGLRIKAGRLKRGVNNLDINLETVALVRSEDVSLVDFPGARTITVQLDRLDSSLVPVASRLGVVPREGYTIVAGEGGITPLRTLVVGPAILLGKIDSIYTEQKILDDINETVKMTLALQKPSEMEIKAAHDSATVEVVIDKIGSRTFENIPVVFSGARNSRVIVDPDKVTVVIEGPQSQLASLSEKQIQVRAASTGKSDDYIIPRVDLPTNFSAKSVAPDSVRVLVAP